MNEPRSEGERCALIASRHWRFRRLRSTARGMTFFATVQANFEPESSACSDIVNEKNSPCRRLVFPLRSLVISERERRFFLGIAYAESFARPFRRRRMRRRRPVVLFERTRNPCVRARFRFFGCHVRFIRGIVNSKQRTVNRKNIEGPVRCSLFSVHFSLSPCCQHVVHVA